ncbi:cytochrome b [Oceanicaulis sp. LC35]|uniref:cytochrome b n=1 Tax=Oceanicaulis sp. LC35 TaxID=3349635 RepID=UPI003F837001
MTTATASSRYTTVAIILHWLIAAMLISLIFVGWWMEDLGAAARAGEVSFDFTRGVYNWHKTAGILVLVLSLVRLGWRLTHPAPALPSGMKPWEAFAAKAIHKLFYVVMIGLPLIGWLMVSNSSLPTRLFNIEGFNLPGLPVPDSEFLHEALESAHGAGAWVIIVLLALHAGAALKHHIIERDGVLTRMLPFVNVPKQNVED